MRKLRFSAVVLGSLVSLFNCGGTPSGPDGGSEGGLAEPDASVPDSSEGGPAEPDASVPDSSEGGPAEPDASVPDSRSVGMDAGHVADGGIHDGSFVETEPDGTLSVDASVDASTDSSASISRVEAASEPDAALDASTDGPVDDGDISGRLALSGAVEKGPFIVGSTVQISAIDAQGSPTGSEFATQTTDNLGHFAISFAYRGYVSMVASGFYFDEVTGGLSAAPITMRALYDITTGGAQSANLNVVTQLAYDRAVVLMGGGQSLEAAEAQAESELFVALGIGGNGFLPVGLGVLFDEVRSNDDTNAYLFAVSALLIEAAVQQGGSSNPDAKLQTLIATVAADLAAAGTLPSSVQTEILAAEQALDVDLTMDFFTERLDAIDVDVAPANLNLAIDSDGDGYTNAIDTCPLVANPVQSTIPPHVLCSVTRHTTFSPYYGSVVGDFLGTNHPGVFGGTPYAPASFAFLPGDGTGRFGPPIPVAIPPWSTDDAGQVTLYGIQLAADINDDGKLDLVAQQGYLPGDGTGHFGPPTDFPGEPFFNSNTNEGWRLAVGDVNGDGLLDVVGGDTDTGSEGIAVLLATSPGVFGTEILTPKAGIEGVWSFVGDLNGDHVADVIVSESGAPAIWFGDGTGHFTRQGASAGSPSGMPVGFGMGQFPSQGWVADFDGDGHLDLASTFPASGFEGGGVEIAFGDGTGEFSTVVTTGSPETGMAETTMAVGDFNGDGKTDVWFFNAGVGATDCSPGVEVMLSEGRSFGASQALRVTQDACSGSLATTADLNGDGIPDIVLTTQAPDGGAIMQSYVVGCGGKACP